MSTYRMGLLRSLFYEYRLTRDLYPSRGRMYAFKFAIRYTRIRRRIQTAERAQ